jgi:hypothetical protein
MELFKMVIVLMGTILSKVTTTEMWAAITETEYAPLPMFYLSEELALGALSQKFICSHGETVHKGGYESYAKYSGRYSALEGL